MRREKERENVCFTFHRGVETRSRETIVKNARRKAKVLWRNQQDTDSLIRPH